MVSGTSAARIEAASIGPVGGSGGSDELLDVERQSVGALVDSPDELGRGRQTGRQQERRHRRGVLEGQPLETDLLGSALCQQARSPVTERGPGRRLVAAV